MADLFELLKFPSDSFQVLKKASTPQRTLIFIKTIETGFKIIFGKVGSSLKGKHQNFGEITVFIWPTLQH